MQPDHVHPDPIDFETAASEIEPSAAPHAGEEATQTEPLAPDAPAEPVHRVSAWDRPIKKANLRRNGRFRCELLECSLGDVRDLSPTGMRVIRKARKPMKVGKVRKIKVQSLFGTIRLRAQVVWSHMSAERTNEMGLTFLDITPGQAEAIKEAAYCSSVRRALGPKQAA